MSKKTSDNFISTIISNVHHTFEILDVFESFLFIDMCLGMIKSIADVFGSLSSALLPFNKHIRCYVLSNIIQIIMIETIF